LLEGFTGIAGLLPLDNTSYRVDRAAPPDRVCRLRVPRARRGAGDSPQNRGVTIRCPFRLRAR